MKNYQKITNLFKSYDETNIELAYQLLSGLNINIVEFLSYFLKTSKENKNITIYKDSISTFYRDLESENPIYQRFSLNQSLSINELIEFVKSFENIEEFLCFNTNLPEKLELPKNIKKIVFSDNGLNNLNINLDYIEKLTIAYNQLEHLIDLPNNIQSLYVYNNKLVNIPSKLPENLLDFMCACNFIKELPKQLPSQLNSLSCAENQITKLPEIPESVTWLHLGNNQLNEQYDFRHLKNANRIDLTGNPIPKNKLPLFPTHLRHRTECGLCVYNY